MRITCLNLSSQSLFISTVPTKPTALLANNPLFCHLLHVCAASPVTLHSVFQPCIVLSPVTWRRMWVQVYTPLGPCKQSRAHEPRFRGKRTMSAHCLLRSIPTAFCLEDPNKPDAIEPVPFLVPKGAKKRRVLQTHPFPPSRPAPPRRRPLSAAPRGRRALSPAGRKRSRPRGYPLPGNRRGGGRTRVRGSSRRFSNAWGKCALGVAEWEIILRPG